MSKILFIGIVLFLAIGCAGISSRMASRHDDTPEAANRSEDVKRPVSVKAKTSIVVDQEDLQALEKMDRALEAFVLKNETSGFKTLCRDQRFDCFVDDVLYPTSKKKTVRKVPPYASGSKMGLRGEKRVQARYDFYP